MMEKRNYDVSNAIELYSSLVDLIKNGKCDEASLGIYYLHNKGWLIPSCITGPSTVKIYGSSEEHIDETSKLVKGLGEIQNGNKE